MSLKNVAEEYFSKINTMANRLYLDMQETKTAYEDLWNTLSHKEQEQVLSESIIKPEISLRYKDIEYKATQEQFATKLIVDDNCSFQDEHSGPFSFKTPSQRDLTIFIKNEEKKEIAHTVKTKKTEKLNVELKPNTHSTGQYLPKTGLDLLDNW